MTFTVYILFSEQLGKYYTGYTGDCITERIRRHNTNHKGFTGQANDWTLAFSKVMTEKSEAMKLEKKIKRRGAKRFLEGLEV